MDSNKEVTVNRTQLAQLTADYSKQKSRKRDLEQTTEEESHAEDVEIPIPPKRKHIIEMQVPESAERSQDDNQSIQVIQQQNQSVADPHVQAEQVLAEKDIFALLGLIHNHSDKWDKIGLGLGFTPSELNQIRSNLSLLMSAPTSFLTNLLSQWTQWPTKDHPTKPTLKVFCETLRSSLVGLGKLAERVEREMKYSLTAQHDESDFSKLNELQVLLERKDGNVDVSERVGQGYEELGIISVEDAEALKQISAEFFTRINHYDGNIQEIATFVDSKLKSIDQPLILLIANHSCMCTPLEYACVQGKTEVVHLLLDRGASMNLSLVGHYSLLATASIVGHVEIVKLLIKYGVDVNEICPLGMSALHEASKFGQAEVVAVLLNHGAKVDLQRKDGCTALMLASTNGKTKAVEILLKYGANVRICSEIGFTALSMACFSGKANVAVILLKHGALVDARDMFGLTPLHIASDHGHTATVQILLEYGVDIDIVSNNMSTALMMACEEGNRETAEVLLKHGAQVNLQDNDGQTALMKAVKNDTVEITKLLLEHGAHVDLQEKHGKSALFIACSNRKVDNAKILVEYGASIHLENLLNVTPISVARKSGDTQLLKILLRQPTLKDALRELLPLSQDWQSIGTFLDIDEDILGGITGKHQNANDALKALLKQWLDRSQPPATWKSLIDAIRPLNENIAAVLTTKYLS